MLWATVATEPQNTSGKFNCKDMETWGDGTISKKTRGRFNIRSYKSTMSKQELDNDKRFQIYDNFTTTGMDPSTIIRVTIIRTGGTQTGITCFDGLIQFPPLLCQESTTLRSPHAWVDQGQG